MLRTLLREIIILVGCLLLVPAIVIIVLLQHGATGAGLHLLLLRMLGGGAFGDFGHADLLIKWLSPYVVVQTIRVFKWSRTSLLARKWSNLYFAVLLSAIAGWAFSRAWDTFYLMYVLGDMPGEIVQLLELEARHLIIIVFCIIIAVHCFRVFWDPTRRNKGGGVPAF